MFLERFKKKNRGFTLVELIVVLVILAILAAILVPALLGYIDAAKKKQDVLNAKNCMTATQAELSELYAKGPHPSGSMNTVIPGLKAVSNGNLDVEAAKSDFANKVFTTADTRPWLYVVGLGHTSLYPTDPHAPYTVLFAMYMQTKDSAPIFFNGSEWVDYYPKDNGDLGASGNEVNGKKMQLYILADAGGKKAGTTNSIWTYIRDQIKKSN